MFGKSSTIIKTVSSTEELAEIDLRILLKTIRQSRKKTLDSLTFDFIELKLKNIELTKGGISLARNILSSDRPIAKIPVDIIHDLMYYLIKDADTTIRSFSNGEWEASAQLTQFDNIEAVYLSTYELIEKSLNSRLKGAVISQGI